MNEIGIMVDIAACIVESWLCFVFCGVLLDDAKFEKNKLYFQVLTIIVVIISELMTLFENYNAIRGGVICLMLVVIQFYFYRKQYLKIILMTGSYMLILSLTDYIVVLFSSFVTRMPLSAFEHFSVYRIICCAVSKTILIILVIFMQKILENRFWFSKKQMWFLLFSNLLVMAVAVYMFESFLQINKIEKSDIILFTLLLLVVLFHFFYSIKNAEIVANREEMKLLNVYNQVLEASMDEKQKNYEAWNKRIHDYKHHVLCMLELSRQKKYEELEEYLQSQAEQLRCAPHSIWTGYPGIDAIVNSKQVLAQSYHLHMICNICLPDRLPLDDMVMASILGNLLDNAIRAGKEVEGSNIELGMVVQRGNLQLKVSNACKEGGITFDRTTKKNSMWHGVGLKSVENTVKELGGEFIIQEKEKMVTALVVLFDVCSQDALGKSR